MVHDLPSWHCGVDVAGDRPGLSAGPSFPELPGVIQPSWDILGESPTNWAFHGKTYKNPSYQ